MLLSRDALQMPLLETTEELSTAIRGELYKPIWILEKVTTTVLDPETQEEKPVTREEPVEKLLRCPTLGEIRILRKEVWEKLAFCRPKDPCTCYMLYHELKPAAEVARQKIARLDYLLKNPGERAANQTEDILKQWREDFSRNLANIESQLQPYRKKVPKKPDKLERVICPFPHCKKQIPVPLDVALSDRGVLAPISEILFKKSWKEIEPKLLVNTPKYLVMYVLSWILGSPEGLPDFWKAFLEGGVGIAKKFIADASGFNLMAPTTSPPEGTSQT
jgi:hypothetical protein